MKQKFAQFMYGRNGVDLFARFLMYAACIMLVISMLSRGFLKSLTWILTLALLIYGYFRVFSKNLNKRREENAKYCAVRYKVINSVRDWKDRQRQKKDYCFFRCPSCRAMLRVPRGKGKIRVTCRKCGNAFERKT